MNGPGALSVRRRQGSPLELGEARFPKYVCYVTDIYFCAKTVQTVGRNPSRPLSGYTSSAKLTISRETTSKIASPTEESI